MRLQILQVWSCLFPFPEAYKAGQPNIYMPFKVGVSSGIYMAARAPELASAVKKLGYTLFKGVGAMEIAADVAHEVPYTMGRQIREMVTKQGVELGFHGDLSVPFETPERGEWRDCQDRMHKSLRSAVFIGAKYIDFHASLGIWLELITYAGRKMSQTFCDHNGFFIGTILKEEPALRSWFIDEYGEEFITQIIGIERYQDLRQKSFLQVQRWRREYVGRLLQKNLPKAKAALERMVRETLERGRQTSVQEIIDSIIETVTIRESVPTELPGEIRQQVDSSLSEAQEAAITEGSTIERNILMKAMDEWLAEGNTWYREESRGFVTIYDGYVIMAHYLFITKDPQWVEMAAQYPGVLERYKVEQGNVKSLTTAIKKADAVNDREFKEFFYAAVAGKFLEGHVRKALEWLYGDFYNKEIPKVSNGDKVEAERLRAIAKELVIAMENPDAREPQHAGLGFLWRPIQIYSAVKTIRKVLKTDKVMIIVDHEHLATQGLDALQESNDYIRTTPDFGSLVKTVHANHPSPLHAHEPIELGDVILYKLLYNLRATGMGKTGLTYLIFERGGGDDPFVNSVVSLKLMAKFLELDTEPAKLPFEFFGLQDTAGDTGRQLQIVKDHAYEPLKDLLVMPDEEFSALSQQVIRGGKRPEQWKKGEFR